MNVVSEPRWPASAASFALVAVLGLFYLPYPLNSDNALFLLFARELAEGARLYVDIWDLKQPGIFWFYLLAGTLFGFDALAMHLLELIWLLLAAVVIWYTARRCFAAQNAAIPLVPLLTTGLYYLTARLWFIAQVEILVALPLAGCLLAGVLAAKDRAFRWWWGALFGLCAAMVATFKLLLIIVPSAMGLAVIALAWDRKKGIVQPVTARFVLPAGIGLVIPLGLIALYSYSVGSWEAFWWTQFVYPPLALLQVEGKAVAELVDAGKWIVAAFLPAALVIALAARGIRDAPLRTDEILVLVWLIAGLVAIILQRNSWLAFHFLLLLFPSGYLVCSAINRVLGSFPSRQQRGIVTATVVLICLLASIKQLPDRWNAILAAWHAPRGEALDQFRETLKPGYVEARMVAAKLRQHADRAVTMAVLGDADLLLMAQLPLALSINGSTVGYLLPEQRRKYVQDFIAKKPEYVFVDVEYVRKGRIKVVYTELQSLLRENYATKFTTQEGVWYEQTQ